MLWLYINRTHSATMAVNLLLIWLFSCRKLHLVRVAWDFQYLGEVWRKATLLYRRINVKDSCRLTCAGRAIARFSTESARVQRYFTEQLCRSRVYEMKLSLWFLLSWRWDGRLYERYGVTALILIISKSIHPIDRHNSWLVTRRLDTKRDVFLQI